MKLLMDNYHRGFARVGHLTWEISLTTSHLWFQSTTVNEPLMTDITERQTEIYGITCEGYLEEIAVSMKVPDYNLKLANVIQTMGLANPMADPWYKDQFRISDRWAPAMTIGVSTFEVIQMYGDTVRVSNIGKERAQRLPVNDVLISKSGRVLLPVSILANVTDSDLSARRVSIAWPGLLGYQRLEGFHVA